MATQPGQSFGMDSNWILQHIMGTTAREYTTEQAIMAISDAIDSDNLKDAKKKAKVLLKNVGNFPELQQLTSMIDRLELLRQDEAD